MHVDSLSMLMEHWKPVIAKVVLKNLLLKNADFTTVVLQVGFTIASDDVAWCKSVFGDSPDIFFTVDGKSHFGTTHQPTFDLAILSLCQHSILR